MTFILTLVGLVVLIVASPILIFLIFHNRVVALDARCDTAFADIDVHLKHRHSLIPGLVETVRGFATHEREVLTRVTEARASAMRAASPDLKLNAEVQLGQSVNSIFNVAEKYPELAASAHFRGLRDELADVENRITASRRFHNLATEEYNATLRQFPGNLVAATRRMTTRQPFDLGIERVLLDEPVAIKF